MELFLLELLRSGIIDPDLTINVVIIVVRCLQDFRNHGCGDG